MKHKLNSQHPYKLILSVPPARAGVGLFAPSPRSCGLSAAIPHARKASYNKLFSLLVICVLTCQMLHAQKNTLTCGGNATGTGGSVSYSIGQLDYINTTNTNGSISQGLQQVYKLNLNLKFFIEGYYAGASQMQSVLFNQGQVANANDADHVTIELHDATSPYNLIHSYTGIVKTDGTISCPFPNANEGESYYIVVKHRGALQTWSKNPVVLNSNVYDFTTNANKAFGDNQILVEPNVYAFYSGDLNQDENIDLLDLGILETDINDFAFGYYASDINGDGNVDLLDSPIIETNINGFVFAVHP